MRVRVGSAAVSVGAPLLPFLTSKACSETAFDLAPQHLVGGVGRDVGPVAAVSQFEKQVV